MDSKATKSELLDVLSDVKTRVQDKLGIVDFPMPQFILIGSQSVGKSRLVESFAGEQFNFISGTLGSRRPTVLEFRNVASVAESKWYILDKDTNQWQHRPTAQVMEIVGTAHNSLGNSVSSEAIHVRVESNKCVDMQIVDLPGYRGFARDEAGRLLCQQIETLNAGFLADPRNVILCVEEAGDAANLSSLRRVSECDPDYKRTILIRNKLDKYYGDLTSDNANKWLEGFGDLPKSLVKFALTLPHWSDGTSAPKPLAQLRDEMDTQDLNKLAVLGTSKKFLAMVGFGNFAKYMEVRIERMFVEAINPVLTKLRDLESSMDQRGTELTEELEQSDPTQMLATVRACGMSFANCLNHVMEGFIRSDINRMTLDDELREFHSYHQKIGNAGEFLALPSEDFGSLDDYIEYLRGHIKVPAFEVAINGGAQFRRLMYEVETFLRFSEMGTETRKRDVLQSFGISMSSVTWREVVVKLLNHDAHLPLQKRIKYVGHRVKWFFEHQVRPALLQWQLATTNPSMAGGAESEIKKVRRSGDDYYAILGVERQADDDTIKKAYRKLALRLHPDKCKEEGAEDAFKRVGEAFSVLSDPQKRRRYDQYGIDALREGSASGHAGPSPEDIFEAFFAQQGGGIFMKGGPTFVHAGGPAGFQSFRFTSGGPGGVNFMSFSTGPGGASGPRQRRGGSSDGPSEGGGETDQELPWWLTKLQSVAGVLGPFLPIAILGMMLLAFLLMSQILSFVVARSHFVLPILYLTEGRTKVLLLLAIGVLGIFGVL